MNGCKRKVMLGTHQRWITLGALAVFLLAGVGAAQTIPLELRTAESGEVYRFTDASAISRLTVSGSVAFDQPNSMVRIILIREDGHEYLIYESFPLMAEEDHFTISTCAKRPVHWTALCLWLCASILLTLS